MKEEEEARARFEQRKAQRRAMMAETAAATTPSPVPDKDSSPTDTTQLELPTAGQPDDDTTVADQPQTKPAQSTNRGQVRIVTLCFQSSTRRETHSHWRFRSRRSISQMIIALAMTRCICRQQRLSTSRNHLPSSRNLLWSQASQSQKQRPKRTAKTKMTKLTKLTKLTKHNWQRRGNSLPSCKLSSINSKRSMRWR
eukprot:TRINITY_DN12225_c5_g1_i4.p1 TRINITY_DN12225_c5_g1~~TRINITY_DN12225_c5_g1_i4.p1  ORF type:complete len:197 (+),score=35.16 TRINITY_DN12225_c5_g1_i4:495-1085(+)